MSSKIAIVGMACRLPDACCPGELWETVLAKRRAFRRIPPQRLGTRDYFSPDRGCPDRTYITQAAVLEGYEFDRLRFRISASSFRAAGLAHWLALDVASEAFQDAGFPDGQGLPHDSTGVFLGNTLTDEFARAELMRLRWPYVRRVAETVLRDGEQSSQQRQQFLNSFEGRYKAPFAPVADESLAGGLSNTIAGRICNHFDLHGGGYTIDGACASSLLAASNGCAALRAGDLNVVLVGGVDLSLDPFELVGFAKIGALAPTTMRVYDRHSTGFWPGEGCGFVVIMRHEDAVAQGKRIYAHICGWGVSSDGSGGLTRPEVRGQLLAVRRAYQRAGFGIHTVTYFEGHGTGTPVGDTTELRALSQARREAIAQTGASSPPAVIGSIKANIGHAKAAAGVAGLIKATLALHKQVLPPTSGCEEPHQELMGDDAVLQVLRQGQRWPADRPLRAGVSSAGFGGINAHLVVEGDTRRRAEPLTVDETNLVRSAQDAELFLFSDVTPEGLREQVERILTYADRLSLAELGDLAGELQRRLKNEQARAAIVASTASELAERLGLLASRLRTGRDPCLDLDAGVFIGAGSTEPQIGLLFPGQASPVYFDSGALGLRFDAVQSLYDRAALPPAGDPTSTEVAQPAIALSSMAGLLALDLLGITASVAVGHSFGELSALHWGGAFDRDTFLRLARGRGQLMANYGGGDGTMAAISAGRREVETLVSGEPVVIAGLNTPTQTVVSGVRSAVDVVIQRAQSDGIDAELLAVSHGFHSPLMKPIIAAFAEKLSAEQFRPLERPVVSTITGGRFSANDNVPALLTRQLTSPVRFTDAFAAADAHVDLWIEAGPGRVLTGLAQKNTDTPVLAMDAGGGSLKGLLRVAGALFALGSPLNHHVLFDDRFTRP
ncbi:MAG: type I polyketide synthase, partial [Planctomycetota bacterium]